MGAKFKSGFCPAGKFRKLKKIDTTHTPLPSDIKNLIEFCLLLWALTAVLCKQKN
jgi:hypothetical protein